MNRKLRIAVAALAAFGGVVLCGTAEARPQTLVFKIGRPTISSAAASGPSAEIKIGNRSQFSSSATTAGWYDIVGPQAGSSIGR